MLISLLLLHFLLPFLFVVSLPLKLSVRVRGKRIHRKWSLFSSDNPPSQKLRLYSVLSKYVVKYTGVWFVRACSEFGRPTQDPGGSHDRLLPQGHCKWKRGRGGLQTVPKPSPGLCPHVTATPPPVTDQGPEFIDTV